MEFLYALPLGLSLSFAAGPIFFVIIETSITKGKGAALSLDIGAVLADVFFILLAYFGSRPLLEKMQHNVWLGLFSGLAVMGFGYYYLRKSKVQSQFTGNLKLDSKGFLIVKGFLLNFLNIGVFLFWLATTVTIGNLLDNEPQRMVIFYIATIGVYLGIDLLKIYFANRFKQKLAGKGMRMIEKIISIILIAFGLFIALRALWS